MDRAQDPDISMRRIAVRFNNAQFNKYDYQTTINGSMLSICKYYRGARLNVANFPEENMQVPMLIEFNSDGDEMNTRVYLNE